MTSLPTEDQYLLRERRAFRVRGVPHDWTRDRLRSFLEENGYTRPAVQSLTKEVHGRSQTATVTFQSVPNQLQERLADPAKGIGLYVPSSDQHNRPRSLMLDTAFLGVTTLYTPSLQDHKVDLVAISGLGGHPFGSFKERHGEHMWLRDALPYDVTEEGGDDRPVSRVMVYGYSSNLFQSDSFQNLEDLGTAFHRHLRKLAIAGAFKPIVFIAHSLGGLIVKQTLISLYKSKDEEDQKLLRAVYGIAFFGVPHDGMDISSLIPMVENGPNRFLLESIGLFSSQTLSTQHREFLETLGTRESKIICFYETRMSPTAIKDERGNWKIAGPAAVLVSKSSATHCREWENGPQFICAINRTHSEMVKFGPEDDEYEKVVELIQSLVREARQTQERKHPLHQISPEQIRKCLQSLAFENMQTRSSGVNDATSGTCTWLLHHETYIRWIASNHGLFWIKGKPGSGKSTLLKYAFNYQKDLSSTTNNTANGDIFLSFFFHDRGEELQKTPFGLFRSLLHQLLKQAPDALSDLVDDFGQKCKDMGNYQEKWKWDSNDLWRFLESSLPRVLAVRSVWLFVDALDECGEINAKDLVKKFKLLTERITPLSTYGNKLRICFSCRHYPILSSTALLEVCLERENRGDISTYVRSELFPYGESMSITIPDLIIDRASGVFLWAELVVKIVVDLGLNGDGPAKIMAAVHSIPKDLDELYKRLIHNMTPASLKLIKWVCFATRPLSVSELRWAMAVRADYSSLNACQNAEDYIPDDDCMKKQIVKLSRGLAEVTMGDDLIVQFIHQSVKDFLIGRGLLELIKEITGDQISPDVAIGMSHFELSKICIQYVAMEEITQLTNYERQKLYADFPFLRYAISSWVAHLKQSDDYGIMPEGILNLFQWPLNNLLDIWTKIYNEIHRYSDGCPTDNTRLEHVAARYNIKGVMNAILRSDSVTAIGVDSEDGSEMTPLAWAAKNGHEDMCRILLATGRVEVDTKYLNNQTPLLSAANQGHQAVVRLLLATKQVDINVEDEGGMTPLSLTARNGDMAMVKLLLDTGQIDFETKNHGNLRSLLFAAWNGHEAIVKLFLTDHADMIYSTSYEDHTALMLAAFNGHKAVVKLLLATGQVEINLKNRNHQTALVLAAENGHEAVVKLLLDTGKVEVNSKAMSGHTALLIAAQNGHEAVVKLLLATGQAEINWMDNNGKTALALATKQGHEAVVKLLLGTGQVEINLKDRDGQTALMLAAMYGYEAVVKLLLDTGQVEMNLKDRDGQTALALATKQGHEAVVKLLLGTGQVDIDSKSLEGWKPLPWEAKEEHKAIIGLLKQYFVSLS
ncbi:Ankyrin repeat domain-containing protein 50 [Trichoderma lentiforme]|uniref:Ankyrin repeat domain-containing protein 50 n=1 Tax=Trichoderma lentiforme TaxID=1567552 RepID=A0A9P5CAY3_9HYPO|nr:Ankyrin repeat domain-containing protein 50 [Trichoderma lentiforme]